MNMLCAEGLRGSEKLNDDHSWTPGRNTSSAKQNGISITSSNGPKSSTISSRIIGWGGNEIYAIVKNAAKRSPGLNPIAEQLGEQFAKHGTRKKQSPPTPPNLSKVA